MQPVPVVIPSRFNGPPRSGHGGYSCGCAAALVDAPAVEVTLRRPPPLERPLDVRRDGDAVALHDGDELVATARPAELEVDGPPAARARRRGRRRRALRVARRAIRSRRCFGCGPARDPADALCLYTGPVGDGRFAVPWTPAPWTAATAWWLRSSRGRRSTARAPRRSTAGSRARSCSGGSPSRSRAPIAVGEPHVIQSWPEGEDGRKRFSAVALFTADGERRACGRGVWFEVPRPRGRRDPVAGAHHRAP